MLKVDLRQIIGIIKSGEWFSVSFIKADLAKNMGGELVEIPKCRIARKQTNDALDCFKDKITDILRPAQHNANFTVNVVLPNKQIRKFHPILVTQINNCQAI